MEMPQKTHTDFPFRIIDVVLSILGISICFPLLVLGFGLAFIDTGKPLFKQRRIGINDTVFMLFKLRTMKIDTVEAPTHTTPVDQISSIGAFLRRTKIDELPQLINVILGDMSLVGPRPCLILQHELRTLRALAGLNTVRPGITGLAQLNNIDMSNPKQLVDTESVMIKNFNLRLYLKILWTTLVKVILLRLEPV